MSGVDRIFATLPWALGGLFCAGIVHLSSILMMPGVARNDAYAVIGGATSGVSLLPDAAVAQTFPFQDPATAIGVCRYDLGAGPARIRTNVADDALVALSFHDRTGRVFYSTTDRAALRGRIDVLVVDSQQLDAIEANDPEDQAPQELRLVAPTRTGFILARALIERAGEEDTARKLVQAVACSPNRQ